MQFFIILFIFTVYGFGFDYHLKSYSVSKDVECFFGLPSSITKNNGGNMVNTCYVETNEGYVVIDSGPTYSYAQQAYTLMQIKKKLPVRYVINTSWDEAHILGNGFYKEQGAILLGPKRYKTYFEEPNKDLLMEKEISKDAFLNTRLTPLDSYLESDSEIILGHLSLSIKYFKDDEYLVVYIPKREILFAGDMLFNDRITPLTRNRSLLVWEKELKELKAIPWKYVVSGHGIKTRRSALKNTQSYLSLLKSEVQESIQNGDSKELTIEKVTMDAFNEDRLYSLWQTFNVASAYDELKVLHSDNKIKQSKIMPLVIKKEPIKSEKVLPKKVLLKESIVKKELPKKEVKTTSIPNIHYSTFGVALREAKVNKKIVLIKVHSNDCPYCDKLDKILATNRQVKELISKYYEMVEINNSYEFVPLNVMISTTPSFVFVRPRDKKVLMIVPGIQALGDLVEILKEGIEDGHNGGYLKP